MLSLKEKNYLSELDRIEGLSIREIMRRTGWHYRTVVKFERRATVSPALPVSRSLDRL